jgi:hypothetical protein
MAKITFAQLDVEIPGDVAEAFIEYRKDMKKPLNQRSFNMAMKEALRAHEVGMTPEELLDFTMLMGWRAPNIAYTKSQKAREGSAMIEAQQSNFNSTRQMSLPQELSRDWAKH